MQERAEDLMRRITELEEKLIREEGRRPIVSPVPHRPTDAEVQEHNVTHTPPQPWCPTALKEQAPTAHIEGKGKKCQTLRQTCQ